MKSLCLLSWPARVLFAVSALTHLGYADPVPAPRPKLSTPFRFAIYADTNDPWGGIFHSRIGGSPVPEISTDDFTEALREFADPDAAIQRLSEIKNQESPGRGAVFAGFRYLDADPLLLISDDFVGDAEIECGVTTSNSNKVDAIHAAAKHCSASKDCPYASESEGSWEGFKASSHAERVRAVARCLSKLPGMPGLKPAPRTIRWLVIDEPSYQLWERFLRKMDAPAVQGTSAQYRAAFECLVSELGRELPDGTGDTVVVRLFREKWEQVRRVDWPAPPGVKVLDPGGNSEVMEQTVASGVAYRSGLAVTTRSNANRLYRIEQSKDLRGPWPSVVEENGDAGRMLPGYERHLSACRRQAGLFELPPSLVSVGLAPKSCDR